MPYFYYGYRIITGWWVETFEMASRDPVIVDFLLDITEG
jgi:hypothetical protein